MNQKIDKISGVKRKVKKVKIDMSVEFEVFVNKNNMKDIEEMQLNNIANVYKSCFGDKDVKIENVKFLS